MDGLGLDFKWFMTGVLSVSMAALLWLFAELQTVKGRFSSLEKEVNSERQAADNELWRAVEEHRREFHAFKEMVWKETVTKGDLAALETRLTQAIRGNRNV